MAYVPYGTSISPGPLPYATSISLGSLPYATSISPGSLPYATDVISSHTHPDLRNSSAFLYIKFSLYCHKGCIMFPL